MLRVPLSSWQCQPVPREVKVRRSKLLQEVETPEKRQTLHLHRLIRLSLPIAIYSLPVDLSMCQFVCLKSIRLELDKKNTGLRVWRHLEATPPPKKHHTKYTKKGKNGRKNEKKNGTTCRLVLLFVSLFGVLLSLILAQHEQKKIRGFVISFDCGDALQNLRSESP